MRAELISVNLPSSGTPKEMSALRQTLALASSAVYIVGIVTTVMTKVPFDSSDALSLCQCLRAASGAMLFPSRYELKLGIALARLESDEKH